MSVVHYSTFEKQVSIVERINFLFIDPPKNLMLDPYYYKNHLGGPRLTIKDLKNKRLSKFIENSLEYVLFDTYIYDLFPDACKLFECRTTVESNGTLLKFKGSRNGIC